MTVSSFVMGAVYVLAGIMHLARPDIYRPIMPPYLPAPDALIFVSGLAQITLGLLVTRPRTRRFAAWGIVALLVAVFPANLYMYQIRDTLWPMIPAALLALRLPLQAALMYWAYRVAQMRP